MLANGHETVGALIERSRVGQHLHRRLPRGLCPAGIRIVSEQLIPQTAEDITEQVTRLHAERPDAIVHCGFGFGMAMTNIILASLDWDPPIHEHRVENAWLNDLLWQAMLGLDRLRPVRRGQPGGSGAARRVRRAVRAATGVLRARRELRRRRAPPGLRGCPPAHARRRPRRVRAGEDDPRRLRLTGTFISFGNDMHRGWVGAGYLVARRLDPDGVHAHRVARFGYPEPTT